MRVGLPLRIAEVAVNPPQADRRFESYRRSHFPDRLTFHPMPYYVYVLVNPAGRFYIGQTQDLERRLREHNDPEDRTTFYTKRVPGPWRLVHSECYPTRSAAMRREKQLKGGRGREWIKTVVLPQRAVWSCDARRSSPADRGGGC